MTWLQLLLSLAVVVLGAELLVRYASLLALRLGLSALFVGLTIVGFGTSSPELAASMYATLRGASDASVGNVIGSNIFNIGVIVGIAALMYPIRIQLHVLRRDLFVAVAAAVVPWFGPLSGQPLSRPIGLLLVLALGVYITAAYRTGKQPPPGDELVALREVENTLGREATAATRTGSIWRELGWIVVGLTLLILGSRVFVISAIELARRFGVSELFIGLTIIAAGTSIPELVTSVVAALRKSPDIAIGNIVGSNIFNVLGILGLCAIVQPQIIRPEMWVDLSVMLILTLALFPIVKSGGVISRLEGALLLVGYAAYLTWLFVGGQ